MLNNVEKTFLPRNQVWGGRSLYFRQILIFLAIISSVTLFILSFPPFDLWWYAWIVYVPVLACINYLSLDACKAYILGVGIISFGLIPIFSGMIAEYSFALYILSILYCAITEGIFFLCYQFLHKNFLSVFRYIALCSIFVLIQFLRTVGPFSFPATLSITQVRLPFLIPLIRFAGSYGIAFLLAALNLSMAEILTQISKKEAIKWVSIGLFSIILLALVPYIFFRSNQEAIQRNNGTQARISIVQGGLPIGMFCVENKAKIIQEYLTLINQNKTDLIVMPETFSGIDMKTEEIFLFKQMALNLNANILYNGEDFNLNHSRKYNSAFLIGRDGRIKGVHHKTRVIPITERAYNPGKKLSVLQTDIGKLGVNICFESLYPDISKKQASLGANIITVMANDAGFGHSIIPELHLRYSILRACENGVWVIHASQAGPSAFISPDGQVISKTYLFEKTNLTETIKIIKTKTFYTQYGDWLVYLSIMVLVSYVLFYLSPKQELSTCLAS